MRNETAEAKKGTWKRKEMHPRPKARRRGKARATPTLAGQRGQELCTSLVVGQQIQGGEGEKEGQAYREERWGGEGGEGQLEASCSSRLTASCTFLLLPPGSSSSPQQTIAPFLLDQKWSMAFSFHIALQTARSLADSSQGKRGGLRTALVRAASQGWPEADRGDGVCRFFVVPALDRRNRSS